MASAACPAPGLDGAGRPPCSAPDETGRHPSSKAARPPPVWWALPVGSTVASSFDIFNRFFMSFFIAHIAHLCKMKKYEYTAICYTEAPFGEVQVVKKFKDTEKQIYLKHEYYFHVNFDNLFDT
jgi:hypothetical protein